MSSFRLSSLLFSIFTIHAATVSSLSLRGQGNEEANKLTSETGTRQLATPTIYYYTTRKHKINYLCWPENTQEDTITKYQGRVCEDGYTIIWDSMKTVASEDSEDPIIGDHGKKCQWSRSTDDAWNAEWLGSGCGNSPDSMTLPRNTDDTQARTYWQTLPHKDSNLCWDGARSSAMVKYEGTMCPDDRTKVVWNSMMTIDGDGNAVVCSDSLNAVWSRYDYDPKKDTEFIKKYFGECGVAPTKFPTLRTTAY